MARKHGRHRKHRHRHNAPTAPTVATAATGSSESAVAVAPQAEAQHTSATPLTSLTHIEAPSTTLQELQSCCAYEQQGHQPLLTPAPEGALDDASDAGCTSQSQSQPTSPLAVGTSNVTQRDWDQHYLLEGLVGAELQVALRVVHALQQGQDLTQLRRIAISQGLVNSRIRAVAWPRLLGLPHRAMQPAGPRRSSSINRAAASSRTCHADDGLGRRASTGGAAARARAHSEPAASAQDAHAHGTCTATCDDGPPDEQYERWQAMPHRDSAVVEVDVVRSLWAFTRGWSDEARDAKRQELKRMLNAVVACHAGGVHYYQGLHDVAAVLLLELGSEAAAFPLLRHLAVTHLRDATRPSLEAVVQLLGLMQPLVAAADPLLARALAEHALQPYYALSWFITWWSHDAEGLATAARLFDVFLASHPLMPLYLGAVAMRSQRTALMGCEDMPEVHSMLTNLRPDRLLPLDQLAGQAAALLREKPPEALVASLGGLRGWLLPPHLRQQQQPGQKLRQRRHRATQGNAGSGGGAGGDGQEGEQQPPQPEVLCVCVAHAAEQVEEGKVWWVPERHPPDWPRSAGGGRAGALMRLVTGRLPPDPGKRRALLSTALTLGAVISMYAAVAVAGYANRSQGRAALAGWGALLGGLA